MTINLLLSENKKREDYIKDPIKDCDKIIGEKIELPLFFTKIPDYGFSKKEILKEITIPPSVTSIGSNAFYRCTSLVHAYIPSSVITIGSSAFR